MLLRRRADVERFLKSPGGDVRAALIFGRDMGVVRERAAELAAASTDKPDDPFDTAQMTEADLDAEPARLEEELAAMSLMGGRRLVRVRLTGGAKAEPALVDALKEHLEGRLNPDAFLLVEAGDLRKESPLRRMAERAAGCAAIPCYEDEIGDIVRFTREALAAEGLGLTSEALQMFAARLPHERGVARREIERLILFLGPGSAVTAAADDLADFLGVEPEASLADAAADAFGGRIAQAHAGIDRAAREGVGGVAAVRAMGAHLARLRRVATQLAGGATMPEALKAAQVFWKAERETSRQARTWTLADLSEVQAEILAADLACKQTGSPDRLLAERLALAVAGRARRLGL